MAGTVTITEERVGSVKAVRFAWTSSAGGAADGTTTYAYNGELLRVVTIPGTGGDQPTNLYDVVLNDADGLDLLFGNGANRSNAAAEQIAASNLGAVANDKLTLGVTNAGNTKKGTVVAYIR